MAVCMTTDLATFRTEWAWLFEQSRHSTHYAHPALDRKRPAPVNIEDVVEVRHAEVLYDEDDECNATSEHFVIVRLNDGRWCALNTSTCSTGTCFNCDCYVAESFEELARWGLTEAERSRLDIKLDITVSSPVS